MFTDPVVGKFSLPVSKDMFAVVSRNTPMFTDTSGETFKVTEEQVSTARYLIGTEIKRVIDDMKKDVYIDDPKFKEKLEATMKIAHAYEKLSEREKYMVASEALRNYPLMEQLANSIYVRDTIDRKGVVFSNYSSELFVYLATLVGETMKSPFSELGDDELGFVDITSRKRITGVDEVQEAIRVNGKRKGNRVFTEPFLAKKRKTKGRAFPPPLINTNVKKVGGPQVRKTRIDKDIQIPIVREKRKAAKSLTRPNKR